MNRPMIILGAALGLFGLPASAGSITGKIRLANVTGASSNPAAGENENVVIWLESQEENAKPPDTAALRISQHNLQFSPDFVVAVKGQKIEMPNDDNVAHNVYSFAGANQFNLGIYGKGEDRSVTFENTGVVDIYCSLHPQMHARAFVVPTPYFVRSLPGQSFTINDVPPGRYVLKAWHERSRMLSKTIVVSKTGTVTENLVLERALPTTSKK